jgi:hypothetical protein
VALSHNRVGAEGGLFITLKLKSSRPKGQLSLYYSVVHVPLHLFIFLFSVLNGVGLTASTCDAGKKSDIITTDNPPPVGLSLQNGRFVDFVFSNQK